MITFDAGVYPDEYHKNLIFAHNWLLFHPDTTEKKKGLDAAIKAFNLNPSPTPLLEVLAYGNFRELSPDVDKLCQKYFDEFEANQDSWRRQDGYGLRVEAVRLASIRLKQYAQRRRKTKLVNLYASSESRYLDRLNSLSENGRW